MELKFIRKTAYGRINDNPRWETILLRVEVHLQQAKTAALRSNLLADFLATREALATVSVCKRAVIAASHKKAA
jgi:hypothetical protein